MTLRIVIECDCCGRERAASTPERVSGGWVLTASGRDICFRCARMHGLAAGAPAAAEPAPPATPAPGAGFDRAP